MRAAIYARKSTEQVGIADEHRSCARQIEHARQFAAARGWIVIDDHIYEDDGISGAEFAKRPGFLRLMNALRPTPDFDVLIMSEESRLGREAIETAYALKQIITAGVRVFFYLEDRERTLQGPTDKLLLSVATFADELERERARQRTYDALKRKAQAGHVTGGRVFGYDNRVITLPSGARSHVERQINEGEAAIVRRIFELALAGVGLRSIALQLNEAAAPAPRSQRGRPRAWCPSSIREVLHRELYRGVIVWNQSKKRDEWGRLHSRPRAASEWIQQPAEHLRIISEDLWRQTHASLEHRRAGYLRATKGQRHGRPVAKPSKYMLSGLVECGQCHGSLVVRTNRGRNGRVPGLACWHYMTRGKAVCTNNQAAPLEAITSKVLDTIRRRLLSPVVLEMAIHLATQVLYEAQAVRDSAAASAAETLAALDVEAGRLVELQVAGVGELPAVVNRLKLIKAQRETLMRLTETASSESNIEDIERSIRDRMRAWREVLTANPATAKPILEGLLGDRIVVTPDAAERGAFVVRIPLEGRGLISGLIQLPKAGASPPGTDRLRFDVVERLAA